MVRTKFYCQEKAEIGYTNTPVKTAKLTFYPVTGNSEENKSFFTATPSGKIELLTVNAEAAAEFEVGKEYYIDFTPAQ